jgi:hypothetical protein
MGIVTGGAGAEGMGGGGAGCCGSRFFVDFLVFR